MTSIHCGKPTIKLKIWFMLLLYKQQKQYAEFTEYTGIQRRRTIMAEQTNANHKDVQIISTISKGKNGTVLDL